MAGRISMIFCRGSNSHSSLSILARRDYSKISTAKQALTKKIRDFQEVRSMSLNPEFIKDLNRFAVHRTPLINPSFLNMNEKDVDYYRKQEQLSLQGPSTGETKEALYELISRVDEMMSKMKKLEEDIQQISSLVHKLESH